MDPTGVRFPTAPSEMIGLEQREQAMPESRHRCLYERLGDHDIQGTVRTLLAIHFIAELEVEQ